MDDAKTIAKDAIKELGEAIDLAKKIRAENASLKAINAELLEALQRLLRQYDIVTKFSPMKNNTEAVNNAKTLILQAKGGP